MADQLREDLLAIEIPSDFTEHMRKILCFLLESVDELATHIPQGTASGSFAGYRTRLVASLPGHSINFLSIAGVLTTYPEYRPARSNLTLKTYGLYIENYLLTKPGELLEK